MSLKCDIDEFIWLAMSRDGAWTLFKIKPYIIEPNHWYAESKGGDGVMLVQNDFGPTFEVTGYNGNCRDSLHKKVKGK